MIAYVDGIPVSELPDLAEGGALAEEWKTFQREVSRLFAEGHAGRYALVKGQEIVSVWDTRRDAFQAAAEKFAPGTFVVCVIAAADRPTNRREFALAHLRTHLPPACNDTTEEDGPFIWEMADDPEADVLAEEWKTVKREMRRLIDEGHSGRHALVKGDRIVGIWNTSNEAFRAGREQFGLDAFMIQEIRPRLRQVRIPYDR